MIGAHARIFLLDDDELVVAMLTRALRGEGYVVEGRTDPARAIEAIDAFGPDLVLLDVRLPGVSGLDLVAELLEHRPGTPVMMLSSDASADSAVRAMKLGAMDYVTKPFDLDEMKLVVAGLLDQAGLKREVEVLRRMNGAELAGRDLTGSSAVVQGLRDAAEKLARAGVNMVLITGENGTGKEQLARYIHQRMHPGSAGRVAPFIGINCAAIPEPLIESELFGHERGAFTDARSERKGAFEIAAGGTILLDELGELRWDLQAKLLRVLEERTLRRVGGRREIPLAATVLATTNRDLEQAVQAGQFRVDLFYRLATFAIHLPPLRERVEDLLPLAREFLDGFAARYGRAPVQGFSPEAERLLLAYGWPGNVRELRNVMERLVVLGSGGQVVPEHLPKELLRLEVAPTVEPPPRAVGRLLLPEDGVSLDAVERDLITQALERTHGNKVHAARLLDVTYDSIRYQVRKLGLEGVGAPGRLHVLATDGAVEGSPALGPGEPAPLTGSGGRRPPPSP
ncbi:MAG: sigma-54 dependent transcriptional regulator [Anaeromyxobacteraceae bacterium]